MDVITYTDEYTSPITPARLFKALILDAHNLIPKLIPQAIKSIEFTQGDGGAGSIRQITFAEGNQASICYFIITWFHIFNKKNYVIYCILISFLSDCWCDITHTALDQLLFL